MTKKESGDVTVALTGLALTVAQGFVNAQVFFPANATYFKPLPDDHACYRMVGLIAAETARIERLIDQAICNIADLDGKVGACFTGQMIGPNPRFDCIQQLAINRGMTDKIVKRIKTVSGHAGAQFLKRNRAVHDPWFAEGETDKSFQFRAKAKKDPEFGHVAVSATELETTLGDIRRFREEVNSLVSDIWTELKPT